MKNSIDPTPVQNSNKTSILSVFSLERTSIFRTSSKLLFAIGPIQRLDICSWPRWGNKISRFREISRWLVKIHDSLLWEWTGNGTYSSGWGLNASRVNLLLPDQDASPYHWDTTWTEINGGRAKRILHFHSLIARNVTRSSYELNAYAIADTRVSCRSTIWNNSKDIFR